MFGREYDRDVAARVVVFLDYQNVYMGARGAFHPFGAPSQAGQIDPGRLGELLASKGPPGIGRELIQVRIYRGQPDSEKDPRGYAANNRQCERWRTLPKASVTTRTLRYPREWPREKEQEKGIDVQLAIDLVAGAVRHESGDSFSQLIAPTCSGLGTLTIQTAA